MTDAQPKNDLITELELSCTEKTFPQWYGLEKLSPPTTPETRNKLQSVRITFRRGVKRTSSVECVAKQPPRPPSRNSPASPRDGRFRIRQTLLARVLDAERPDLVAFTSDRLNGQGTSWDAKSVFARFERVVSQRKISWASCLETTTRKMVRLKGTNYGTSKDCPIALSKPGLR